MMILSLHPFCRQAGALASCQAATTASSLSSSLLGLLRSPSSNDDMTTAGSSLPSSHEAPTSTRPCTSSSTAEVCMRDGDRASSGPGRPFASTLIMKSERGSARSSCDHITAGTPMSSPLSPSTSMGSSNSNSSSQWGYGSAIAMRLQMMFTRGSAQMAMSNAWASRVPYSKRSGTTRPSPWPTFEPVKTTASGQVKWQRTLYRFGEGIAVRYDEGGSSSSSSSSSSPSSFSSSSSQGSAPSVSGGGGAAPPRTLTLSGKAGSVTFDLRELDPSGLAAFRLIPLSSSSPSPPSSSSSSSSPSSSSAPEKRPPLLALASPDKARFASIVKELDAAVRGVTTGYLVGITVKGVGYRIEPMVEAPRKKTWYFEDDLADRGAIAYPHPTPVPAVRLKVGYSRTAVFPLPPNIRAFCIKPTLLYLYGLRQEELGRVAAAIRAVRKPNVYTGNGIQLVDEVVRIKQRKASK